MVVVGPSKAEVTCKDNHDGTCTVDYVPTKAGDYDITVKFADKDIPGTFYPITCLILVILCTTCTCMYTPNICTVELG